MFIQRASGTFCLALLLFSRKFAIVASFQSYYDAAASNPLGGSNIIDNVIG